MFKCYKKESNTLKEIGQEVRANLLFLDEGFNKNFLNEGNMEDSGKDFDENDDNEAENEEN